MLFHCKIMSLFISSLSMTFCLYKNSNNKTVKFMQLGHIHVHVFKTNRGVCTVDSIDWYMHIHGGSGFESGLSLCKLSIIIVTWVSYDYCIHFTHELKVVDVERDELMGHTNLTRGNCRSHAGQYSLRTRYKL